MYSICIICNNSCYENNPLTNGKDFHKKCYDGLLIRERGYYTQLSDTRNKIYTIETDERKLFTRIKAYFGYESQNRKQKEKNELNEAIEKLNNGLLNIKNQLKSLYDYWPERPPDWEERRQRFIEQKPFCEECLRAHIDNVILQVHHIVPISKGGSHKVDNLKVLCKSCHQSQHPFNDFNSVSNYHTNHFKEKVKILNEAIKRGNTVFFNYKKWEGEKSSRQVKPQGFKLVGKTLCVYGFCYLRNDNRTFAIKRINKLKVQ